jgi:hypothetical protein
MKQYIPKIASRKFLIAVAILIALFKVIDNEVLLAIVATCIVISYMFSEALVDSARAIKREVIDRAIVTKNVANEDTTNADK